MENNGETGEDALANTNGSNNSNNNNSGENNNTAAGSSKQQLLQQNEYLQHTITELRDKIARVRIFSK